MSQDTFCQYLTQLNTFLIKAIHIPKESLEHYFVLKMCQKCSQASRIHLITNDNTGWTSTFKVLIAVVVFFTAGKCDDLSCYIRSELLLACASLNLHISVHLVVTISYKLKRHNIGSLMKELIERVLSISSRFAKDHRSSHIIYRFTETVY